MSQIASLSRTSIAVVNGQQYKLAAFYFPGKLTAWDAFYNYEALANFFVCPKGVPLDAENISATFHCAEAAFQATKWWLNAKARQDFENAADGDDAFRISRELERSNVPQSSPPYAGLGRLGSMQQILLSKFSQDKHLQDVLLSTGDAYLLEHNEKAGRDKYWSDNFDGSGENHLGLTLMELRQKLGGAGQPSGNYEVVDFTKQVQSA